MVTQHQQQQHHIVSHTEKHRVSYEKASTSCNAWALCAPPAAAHLPADVVQQQLAQARQARAHVAPQLQRAHLRTCSTRGRVGRAHDHHPPGCLSRFKRKPQQHKTTSAVAMAPHAGYGAGKAQLAPSRPPLRRTTRLREAGGCVTLRVGDKAARTTTVTSSRVSERRRCSASISSCPARQTPRIDRRLRPSGSAPAAVMHTAKARGDPARARGVHVHVHVHVGRTGAQFASHGRRRGLMTHASSRGLAAQQPPSRHFCAEPRALATPPTLGPLRGSPFNRSAPRRARAPTRTLHDMMPHPCAARRRSAPRTAGLTAAPAPAGLDLRGLAPPA